MFHRETPLNCQHDTFKSSDNDTLSLTVTKAAQQRSQ